MTRRRAPRPRAASAARLPVRPRSRSSISSRCRPCQAPWWISRKPGSGRRSIVRPDARNARSMAAAVWLVRWSGECTSSIGSPTGTGNAGGSCGSASRRATSSAWRSPSGERGESACPWKRPSTMNVDSPWRTRTSVASRPSGMSRGGSAVSVRLPAGSSTGRGRPRASGSPRRRHRGRRRRGRGS